MPLEFHASRQGPVLGEAMRSILVEHAVRYPKWSLDDLYKLLHQAALGSEHAITDEAPARAWLTQELGNLSPGPNDPLIDPISPDGLVIRVHLRPFASFHLDPEVLLTSFIRTARFFRGSPDTIVDFAHAAANLAREGVLPFGSDAIMTYVDELKTAGFPPVHHSPGFEEAYRPAYRVVSRVELPKEILAAA
jgi:hypothetical protein